MLIVLNEGIAHLVYSKCNLFVVDGGYNVQHGIKWSQNLQIPKLKVKIKTSGLIQKCSSNHTTRKMVTKIYHVKLIYNGSIQKWCIHALKLYLWLILLQGWTRSNAHIGVIFCCSFYSFCYMMMSKYLIFAQMQVELHLQQKPLLLCLET